MPMAAKMRMRGAIQAYDNAMRKKRVSYDRGSDERKKERK
jgi:hypothetical protein